MTKDRRAGAELADDLPSHGGYPGRFMMKLMGAWMAMGFRRPDIALGKPLTVAPTPALPPNVGEGRSWP